MLRIGLLSDTHGFINPKAFKYFEECDEIWHAGDIGNIDVADELAKLKPFKAVFGNVDNHIVRSVYPEHQIFKCERVIVLLTHIAGYPNKYIPKVRSLILEHKPNLVIAGHSHILKVMFDQKLNHLHVNPGAAGNYGFHLVKTIVRFTIDDDRIKDLEVIELGRK